MGPLIESSCGAEAACLVALIALNLIMAVQVHMQRLGWRHSMRH